jgi:antitoxin MazE
MYILCRYTLKGRYNVMRRRIQRWGNSLAVRIPAEIVRACALTEGTELLVKQERGRVVLVPERPTRRKYTLDELVAGISRRNRHAPFDDGRPAGQEAW